MKHSRVAFLLFFVCAYFGFRMASNSWQGVRYVYLGDDRAPAALHNLRDFSKLDAKALSLAAHNQLVSHAEIIRQSDQVGVKLGHFITRTAEGRREFACAVQNRSGAYDRISMSFMGLGVSDSGEVPTVTVETNCKSSTDLDWLETVWIPMNYIAALGNNDQEIQTYEAEPMTISIAGMTSDWPESWVLTKVRLFQEGRPDEAMVVDTTTMPSIEKQKFSFEWKIPSRLPSNSVPAQ